MPYMPSQPASHQTVNLTLANQTPVLSVSSHLPSSYPPKHPPPSHHDPLKTPILPADRHHKQLSLFLSLSVSLSLPLCYLLLIASNFSLCIFHSAFFMSYALFLLVLPTHCITSHGIAYTLHPHLPITPLRANEASREEKRKKKAARKNSEYMHSAARTSTQQKNRQEKKKNMMLVVVREWFETHAK
ncbi:hypothetical protein J3F83DRAFT_733588 [Trichoderma novae-zelandiae]